uniref:Gag-pol protein n=1 Tax=Solanum tuberosum TaxID=4113 RepID=M1A3B6_SOLTU
MFNLHLLAVGTLSHKLSDIFLHPMIPTDFLEVMIYLGRSVKGIVRDTTLRHMAHLAFGLLLLIF